MVHDFKKSEWVWGRSRAWGPHFISKVTPKGAWLVDGETGLKKRWLGHASIERMTMDDIRRWKRFKGMDVDGEL